MVALKTGPHGGAARPPVMRNEILLRLPADELASLRPSLERVELRRNQTLHHSRTPMQHVYFIEDGLVAVSSPAERDRWVDVWLIGPEGLVGVPLVLGNYDGAPFRRTVRVAGSALRLPKDALHQFMSSLPEFRNLLLRFVELVVVQTGQGSVCNATHSMPQRLSRWLLLIRDRLGNDTLPLTHQAFARILGVRRPSITTCLRSLEEKGAIRMQRGCTHIREPSRLQDISCDCNRILQQQRHRLLGMLID